MFTLLSVLIVMVCVLLVLVVLVQNSKGGGLAANFGASSQIMGVRRTADFLEKATQCLVFLPAGQFRNRKLRQNQEWNSNRKVQWILIRVFQKFLPDYRKITLITNKFVKNIKFRCQSVIQLTLFLCFFPETQ